MALMLSLPSYTMGQAPPPAAPSCLTNNLVNDQVAACGCAKEYSEIGCNQCPHTGCKPALLKAPLNSCDGCTNSDINCGEACKLYFTSLCHCLKGAKGCQKDKNTNWWLLGSHYLITSQDKIAGILQLGSDNGGWALGQNLFLGGVDQKGLTIKRNFGTLSVNSVTVRDQDQIHIHVCYNKNSLLRDFLTTLHPADYKNLKRIPMSFKGVPAGFPADSILCEASQTKGASDIDVAGITAGYLNGRTKCFKDDIGAGLITDGNDFSWVCLTTTPKASGEQLFCHT